MVDGTVSKRNEKSRVVIAGSGIAGLLAARVASDYFDEVIVIERDKEPTEAIPRKGVPQGHHIHVLLNKGEEILEELFPGIRARLTDSGSVKCTLGKDVKWYLAGKWMPSFEGGMVTFFQSRPLLEHIIRSSVNAIGNVRFLYTHRVETYNIDETNTVFRSVVVMDTVTGICEAMTADLFIESSGRGSQFHRVLENLGQSAVKESCVGVDFAYSSGVFEIDKSVELDRSAILVYPKAPEETRAAAMIPIEEGKWLATAAGYSGDHPPVEPKAFLNYIGSISQPHIYEKLKKGRLVGDLKQFKFKSGVRRHYEKSTSQIQGMLVVGDAICSANPFFGQGIAVAAQEAKVLEDLLRENGPRSLNWSSTVIRGYYRRISKILDISWGLAIGEDLKYPTTTGNKPFGYAASRFLKDRIMSSNSPEVAKQFYRVMHFVEKPKSLASLRILKALIFKKQ